MKTQTERIDAALDAALSMTFPASDPIAPFVSQPSRSLSVDDEEIDLASNAN